MAYPKAWTILTDDIRRCLTRRFPYGVLVDQTAPILIADPSGILQPYATWDITQNLQLTGGLSVSYGAKGTEYGGFTLPGTDICSKSPDSAYLWLIYCFLLHDASDSGEPFQFLPSPCGL